MTPTSRPGLLSVPGLPQVPWTAQPTRRNCCPQSVTTCPNWALMASPSAVPYLLTRAALIWAADMLAPDAGSTDTTAIAFPNDMSRSKYPMAHESWLSPPPVLAADVNWLTSALVHWPGADRWAGPAHAPGRRVRDCKRGHGDGQRPSQEEPLPVRLDEYHDSPLIRASPVWTGFVLSVIAGCGFTVLRQMRPMRFSRQR